MSPVLSLDEIVDAFCDALLGEEELEPGIDVFLGDDGVIEQPARDRVDLPEREDYWDMPGDHLRDLGRER